MGTEVAKQTFQSFNGINKIVMNLNIESVQLLSDELSEVSDNLKLTVQFLSDDFAAVSELSGKNLR